MQAGRSAIYERRYTNDESSPIIPAATIGGNDWNCSESLVFDASLKRKPRRGRGSDCCSTVYCTGADCGVVVGAGVVIVLGGGATVVDGACVVCESVWLHAASANAAIPSTASK